MSKKFKQFKAATGNGQIWVAGRNAVLETLRHSQSPVVGLWKVAAGGEDEASRAILASARARQVKVHEVSRDFLDDRLHVQQHQGFALQLEKRSNQKELSETLDSLSALSHSRVLVLGQVQDPHHLGAAFRAADCFGFDCIFWPRNDSCGITATVTKVAVGATELVPCCEVGNVNDALTKLKKAGYWLIAADASEQSAPLNEFQFPEKCALLFGGEGRGIKPLQLKQCDFQVRIPMQGTIDSLSLSQAIAVLAYAASCEKKCSASASSKGS